MTWLLPSLLLLTSLRMCSSLLFLLFRLPIYVVWIPIVWVCPAVLASLEYHFVVILILGIIFLDRNCVAWVHQLHET